MPRHHPLQARGVVDATVWREQLAGGFVVLALIVRRRRSAAVQGANELSAEERERLAKWLEKEQTHD